MELTDEEIVLWLEDPTPAPPAEILAFRHMIKGGRWSLIRMRVFYTWLVRNKPTIQAMAKPGSINE
jgi:hypothetical protein